MLICSIVAGGSDFALKAMRFHALPQFAYELAPVANDKLTVRTAHVSPFVTPSGYPQSAK